MNLNNWNLDIVPTIFISIFFPLFLYISYWFWISGIIGLYRMIKSAKWKLTIGKIIDAEVKFMDFSSEGSVTFKFIIEKKYVYNIDEVEYISNQTLSSDSLYAKDFKPINKFPKKYGEYSSNLNYINA